MTRKKALRTGCDARATSQRVKPEENTNKKAPQRGA